MSGANDAPRTSGIEHGGALHIEGTAIPKALDHTTTRLEGLSQASSHANEP
jgi:hypothetical protein